MRLLARCQNCGFIFPGPIEVPDLHVVPGMVVYNNATNCPNCGGIALSDNVIGGVISSAVEFAQAPGVTPQVLAAARSLAEELAAGRKSLEEVKKEAARIHPDLAPKITDWINAGTGVFLAIIAAITLYLAFSQGKTNDAKDEKRERQIERMTAALERVSREQFKAPAPPKIEDAERQSGQTKQPQKNRKTRRAEAAQARKKKG